MTFRLLVLTLLVSYGIATINGNYSSNEVTEWGQRNRQKRFILYETAGVCKLLIGFILPVVLGDKRPWRTLNIAYNFQAQYALPSAPIYWWDKWDGRTLADVKMQYNRDGTFQPDESRQFLYAVIEIYANRAGKNGKKCLLREICENANVDVAEGVFAEILKTILTPGDDSDQDYRDAYKAGRYGAKCATMYSECPPGEGIFDQFITIEHEYSLNET